MGEKKSRDNACVGLLASNPGSNSLKRTMCVCVGGYCRVTASGGAYARITIYNASTLTYEHVQVHVEGCNNLNDYHNT